jgi:hypothetical protein
LDSGNSATLGTTGEATDRPPRTHTASGLGRIPSRRSTGMGKNHINTRRMHVVRKAFRDECEAKNAPCWICNQEIEYAAPHDDYKNDARFQLDHYHPASKRPDLYEVPSNFRPSHAGCNRVRGAEAPRAGLRPPSRDWI